MSNAEITHEIEPTTGIDKNPAVAGVSTLYAGLSIRQATEGDIDDILDIIESARSYMRETGNFSQWTDGYPGRTTLIDDVARQNLYVGENDNHELAMAFAFILGEDPTYTNIDGRWLNDAPYGTVHRLASNGKHSGILNLCARFCLSQTDNIRIDTHKDNHPMLRALKKCGFEYCGVIICNDGTPREAFQLDNRNPRKHSE